MKLKRSYRVLRGFVRAFSPTMRTVWETPFTGEPSVFICNHAGAMGPIAVCARFPLADTLHPWMNAQVLSAREVPAYVRQDYWWSPGDPLAGFYNRTLPYLAAAILPPILRTTPTVPVYHDARVIRTLRESLRVLQSGEHLVIFPEQPAGHRAHCNSLNKGFLQLAPAYVRVTGCALAFWPVHIDASGRAFHVSAPLYFDPGRSLPQQETELLQGLKRGIHPEDAPAPSPAREPSPAAGNAEGFMPNRASEALPTLEPDMEEGASVR